jgi:hypothetical protein
VEMFCTINYLWIGRKGQVKSFTILHCNVHEKFLAKLFMNGMANPGQEMCSWYFKVLNYTPFVDVQTIWDGKIGYSMKRSLNCASDIRHTFVCPKTE